MALGVEKALEEVYGKITVEDTDVELEEDITEDTTKNDKRIFVYGVNGSPDVKEVLASKESYIVATVAQSPINMGMQAVEIAVDLIKNRDYDKEVTTMHKIQCGQVACAMASSLSEKASSKVIQKYMKRAEYLLDEAGITCNKNTIPFDEQKPFVTSGIRLGSAAMTSRGFRRS